MVIPNVPAFVVWYYATLRIGAVAVSISTRLAARRSGLHSLRFASMLLLATDEHHEAAEAVISPTALSTALALSDDASSLSETSSLSTSEGTCRRSTGLTRNQTTRR